MLRATYVQGQIYSGPNMFRVKYVYGHICPVVHCPGPNMFRFNYVQGQICSGPHTFRAKYCMIRAKYFQSQVGFRAKYSMFRDTYA